MTVTPPAPIRRSRSILDVESPFLDRVRRAAAEKNLSLRTYLRATIQRRLLGDVLQAHTSAMTVATDPVLAELWGNPLDAAYDRR